MLSISLLYTDLLPGTQYNVFVSAENGVSDQAGPSNSTLEGFVATLGESNDGKAIIVNFQHLAKFILNDSFIIGSQVTVINVSVSVLLILLQSALTITVVVVLCVKIKKLKTAGGNYTVGTGTPPLPPQGHLPMSDIPVMQSHHDVDTKESDNASDNACYAQSHLEITMKGNSAYSQHQVEPRSVTESSNVDDGDYEVV